MLCDTEKYIVGGILDIHLMISLAEQKCSRFPGGKIKGYFYGNVCVHPV